MKTCLITLPLAILILSCHKIGNSYWSSTAGKNTLSYKVNGQLWQPKGFNGTANLSIDYDEGIRNGIFNVAAYRIIDSTHREYFGIGMTDSLKLLKAPF